MPEERYLTLSEAKMMLDSASEERELNLTQKLQRSTHHALSDLV